ncbi:OmpH family outer membrane protein [Ferrimonas lipolytica]|uniref:OmpH family outer membrane protein n=1 Tax=Ferrimonas lipolytica TaxID=2724191 RepID=A0A6H1UGP6_9GAMM|nr:OmpH family outer membrane protein [Ferrimonas lipolytica]QIZ77386.1 OmpH family outer membrane protein [Ferrimonas lipolytica]
MKKVIATVALVLAVMAPAAYAEQKIAVINMQGLVAQHPEAETLQQRVQDAFAERMTSMKQLQEKGVSLQQKLEKDGAIMSAAERTDIEREMQSLQADLQLKGKALNEDMQKRGQEEQRKILLEIGTAIEAVAKEQGYDIVLESRSVMFADEKHNISAKVLEAVQKGN